MVFPWSEHFLCTVLQLALAHVTVKQAVKIRLFSCCSSHNTHVNVINVHSCLGENVCLSKLLAVNLFDSKVTQGP